MRVAPVVLEGKVVRLEPLRRHHAALLSAVNDPRLWDLTPTRIDSAEMMAQRIQELLADEAAGSELPLATIERASGTVVGSTRYMNIDTANRRVEIGGTWIAPAWQRTAVNTEAKYLMLRHAFETWRCVRVEFKTDALNIASRNAILRIGAKEEGTLRRHVLTWSGRYRDTVYFSILDDEWPAIKANLERMLVTC